MCQENTIVLCRSSRLKIGMRANLTEQVEEAKEREDRRNNWNNKSTTTYRPGIDDTFGDAADGKKLYCRSHKKPSHVNLANRRLDSKAPAAGFNRSIPSRHGWYSAGPLSCCSARWLLAEFFTTNKAPATRPIRMPSAVASARRLQSDLARQSSGG